MESNNSTAFKRYEQGLKYKDKLNLRTKWNTYTKFKAGEQWAKPTLKTKTMPRPVFNFIDQIINHKVSSIQNENIKMVFTDTEGLDDQATMMAQMFSKYSETTWEEIKQDRLNQEALDNAGTLGIGIWHYYFDSSKMGGNYLAWMGEIKGEILDPMNVVFGNPNDIRVQEQPYIVIKSRGLIQDIKDLAKGYGATEDKLMLITSDNNNRDNMYDKANIEDDSDSMVNLYTMYYKKKVQEPFVDDETGEEGTKTVTKIFFTKSVKNVEVVPETELGIELYPVATMNWYKEKECIYGRSETEGLIPNQKLLNFLIAMQSYSVQLNGFPKMIYKRDAINPKAITNQIGEIIEDMSQGNGFNVQYLNPPAFPVIASNLAETVLQYTKDLKGATESNTGENTGSQLNATAIMLLQKASGIPLEAIKKRFYDAIEDIGRIWEQFWKKKYITERIVQVKDQDNQDVPIEFRGSDADGMDFKLKIDIGQASSYTESFTLTALDNFLGAGYITFEQYLKYVPNTVVPFKNQLLQEIKQMNEQQQQDSMNQIIAGMNPTERMMFEQALPEEQAQIINDIMLNSGMQPSQATVQQPQAGGQLNIGATVQQQEQKGKGV